MTGVRDGSPQHPRQCSETRGQVRVCSAYVQSLSAISISRSILAKEFFGGFGLCGFVCCFFPKNTRF